MSGLVFGVARNNRERTSKCKQYTLWISMLQRCFDRKNIGPSYTDCKVSDEFLDYTYFHDWCILQKGFGSVGWQLDKDILLKNNKIYTQNVCVFVPKDVNVILTKSNAARGELPIGVDFVKIVGKYRARLLVGKKGQHLHLGYFENAQDAFFAYKLAKEAQIKLIANKFKNEVDERVYDALTRYEVEITD